RTMREFLAKHRIPGAALAVTRHGRLVYARGFGLADLAKADPVRPDALFRIASVSKPVTAAAVPKLAEPGRLTPHDGALDPPRPGLRTPPADPRWGRVTVRELLQHRGGWDRQKSFDPMFRSARIARSLGTTPPAAASDVVRYMLGQPLDFDPGAREA